MKNFDRQVHFWAHMLDETKHQSWYDVYMQIHPEDKTEKLIYSLVDEFAKDLKKNNIDISSCIAGDDINYNMLKNMQKKIAYKYYWKKIPAQVYAAIITRYVAMMDAAKGQRYVSELDYEDVRRSVSKKTIEDCLDIVCHNTNVLVANNCIVRSIAGIPDFDRQGKFISSMSKRVEDAFSQNSIPKIRYKTPDNVALENYYAAIELYKAWGAYVKGNAAEEYVCDSDNGPEALKKVLKDCEYDADEVELIATLNKAVDVVHFRSDLAAAFLEGGQKTAALVSNLPQGIVV